MVNNIIDNSEVDAKKRLNTLNLIKKSKMKHKTLIPGQKELLNLFNNLSDIILTDKILKSKSKEEKNKNKNEKVESKKKENKEENEKVESKKEENKEEKEKLKE